MEKSGRNIKLRSNTVTESLAFRTGISLICLVCSIRLGRKPNKLFLRAHASTKIISDSSSESDSAASGSRKKTFHIQEARTNQNVEWNACISSESGEKRMNHRTDAVVLEREIQDLRDYDTFRNKWFAYRSGGRKSCNTDRTPLQSPNPISNFANVSLMFAVDCGSSDVYIREGLCSRMSIMMRKIKHSSLRKSFMNGLFWTEYFEWTQFKIAFFFWMTSFE